jgi:uncharacterized protein YjbI with pentapeptide repeats
MRVEFHRCRMSGAMLAGSTLRDVLFTECRLDTANLRMVEGRQCELLEADLRCADLYAARLTASRIQDCDLSGAELSQAMLERARLHGSVLRDLKGVGALAGAVIGSDQQMDVAMSLLGASGITVDDER